MLALLLACFLLAACHAGPTAPPPPLAEAVAIPTGDARLQITVGDTPLEVFTCKPADYRGERLLLVMHGVLRNADEYRDHARGMAERFGALVVAPRFDSERFPSRRYQRGGILREDGSAAPPAEWTYALIPQLVARVRALEQRPQLPWWIVGHSAGGQFVMRMAAFLPADATRLVAANPGSALLPVRDVPFGYGFGGLPPALAGDDVLARYLAAPLTIYCGTADDAPDDNFDRSAEAMAQGGGRHQRNLACYWTARTLAQLRGWPFGWRLVEAPGIGHDHERMFDAPACAEALFGPAVPTAGAK